MATDEPAPHQCTSCGETFQTLSRKRLHQKSDCPALDEVIDTEGMDTEEIVDQMVSSLSTCERCEREHQGEFTRADSQTGSDYSVELQFTCEHCGFHNVNTAILG